MKHFQLPRPTATLFKTFLLFSIFSVIPLFSMAFYFSAMAERFWKSETYRYNQKAFSQYTNSIDDQILTAQQTARQMAENPSFLSFITNPTFREVERNTLIMKALNDVQTADNGIDSAFLYSSFEDLILTSDKTGYTYDEFQNPSMLDRYKENNYSSLTTQILQEPDGAERNYITLYQNLPQKSLGTLGCLIFNMDMENLFVPKDETAILEFSVYAADDSCLYTQNPDGPIPLTQDFKNQIYKSNGSFTSSINSEEQVVLSSFSPVTGWIYIGTAPIPVFFNSYRTLSKLLKNIAIVALILSFLFSLIASYRVYLPLKRLADFVSEKKTKTPVKNLSGEYGVIQSAYQEMASLNHDMEEIVQSMRPAVASEFFFSVLLRKPISPEEIDAKLQFIGKGFTAKEYAVILFQISDYEEYSRNFSESAQSLHQYILSKTADSFEEKADFPCVLLKINSSSWAFILNLSGIHPDKRSQKLKTTEEFFEQYIKEYPFLQAARGGIYPSLLDLYYSYQDALEVLKRQQYQDSDDRALLVSAFSDAKSREALFQAIQNGAAEEAEIQCRNIFSSMSENFFSSEQMRSAASSIVSASLEILMELKIDLPSSLDTGKYYQLLESSKDAEELCEHTISILKNLIPIIQAFHHTHSNRMVDRMVDYINQHLQEDLSLNNLAEISGLTPPYVSRLFKENLHMGFVEYLNTLRISRAKKLLKETPMTVEQIGFQVGFRNVRSFMRTFKQYENTTPGQYRAGV